MRSSAPLQTLTFIAFGAVAQGRCVGFDGAQASASGQKVAGIATTAAGNGEAYGAVTSGTAIAEAGGAIQKGDSLICDALGRAIPATGALSVAAGAVAVTSGAANGAVLAGADLPEFVFADALDDAAGAGSLVEVLLRR